MLFKVSQRAYAGGREYAIHKHDDGTEFYRGPSLPGVVQVALGDREAVYFDWGYDAATNSVDLVGGEVPAPSGG